MSDVHRIRSGTLLEPMPDGDVETVERAIRLPTDAVGTITKENR